MNFNCLPLVIARDILHLVVLDEDIAHLLRLRHINRKCWLDPPFERTLADSRRPFRQ
jgi:hypothetical protein